MSPEPSTRHCLQKVSALRSQLSALSSPSGFTALELIIVIMVLSVLAASVIIKNPFSIQDYSSMAADQLIADIRYVQIRAMGIGSSQKLSFTNGSDAYSIRDASNNVIEQKNLAGNITVISTTLPSNILEFDSLGEPTIGGVVTVGSSQYIKVFSITGYVCKCKNSACNASECLN
ncbi:MAG: type II secretion system protein [Syntrophorhabdaceae bacterium]|nr:type II secretion system protein [Syntrophorhabdaceae bacterium]MDD5244615.1 type II secretion system protein [Syntrophorhabdaceae bacterium]